MKLDVFLLALYSVEKITSFCFDYMRMFQKQVAKDIALQLFIYTVFATQSRSTPAKLLFFQQKRVEFSN